MRRVTFATLAMLWVASPAIAEAKGYLVLKLEHEGLSGDVAGALQNAIRAGVKKAKPRVKLLPTPKLDFSGMQMAAGCMDDGPKCLATMGRPLGANRVLRVVMSGSDTAKVSMTLVRVGTGKTERTEITLESVSAESATELTHHVATFLGAKLPPLTGGISLLMASDIGSLEGAELFLDDKKVARPALEAIEVGNHRLEVHQKGFETFIWMGQVRPGRNEEVRVKLEPSQVATTSPPPPAETAPPPPVETAPPPPSGDPATTLTTTPVDTQPVVYTFVFGAAAVVAAGVGVAFLVIGQNVSGDYEDQSRAENEALGVNAGMAHYDECVADPSRDDCDPNYQTLKDRHRKASIGNIAGFATAGAFAIGAVAAFFIERSLAEPDADTSVAFGVAPKDGGATAAVSLTF